MCRHHAPKTLCGVDPTWYQQRITTERRFRLYLCKQTQQDIINILSLPNPPRPKALARQCGLHFGRDQLGRILGFKFADQVKFLQKRVRKSKEREACAAADAKGRVCEGVPRGGRGEVEGDGQEDALLGVLAQEVGIRLVI